MEDAEKKKILKNSLEVFLAEEQKEILRLEFELGQHKDELKKAHEEIDNLEEQLFLDGTKYSFASIKNRIREKFYNKLKRSDKFKKRNNSSVDKLNYILFFAYSAYAFLLTITLQSKHL